jgi:HAD superfamily hydrolase (TIGR01509 family)
LAATDKDHEFMETRKKLQKRAILFDMDGTLVGLKPSGRLAVLQRALAQFGIDGVEQEHADRFWFSAERYVMLERWGLKGDQFWPVLDSEELLQIQYQHTVCFKDAGIIRLLARQNLHLGIVSNSAHVSLKGKIKLLSRYVNPTRFSQVISCSDDAPRPKPCPSGILLGLERMGVEPHEALLVGDSMDDVRAGNAAGVDVIIIDRGEPIVFDTSFKFQKVNSLWKLRNLLDTPARVLPAYEYQEQKAA